MKLGKIIPLLLVVLQFATATFAEFGHTDVIAGGSHSTESLVSHNCGAVERHPDLGQIHSCLACYRAANFVASIAPLYVTSADVSVLIARPLRSTYQSACFLSTYPKRGPPLILSL